MSEHTNEPGAVVTGTLEDAAERYRGAQKAQEEVRRLPNIHQRLHAVMRDVRRVRKDRVNKFHDYKYVGHDDVTEPLSAAFLEHGVFQVVDATMHDRNPLTYEGKKGAVSTSVMRVKVRISWVNIDNPTDKVTVDSFGESEIQAGRNADVQAGMAVSYAVKLAQLKTFMLIGGGVEDPEASSGEREAAPGPAREVFPEEELLAMIKEYDEVADKQAFSVTRAKAGTIVKKLDQHQHARLVAADEATARRINGK